MDPKETLPVPEVEPEINILHPDKHFKVSMEQQENSPVSEADPGINVPQADEDFEVAMDQQENPSVSEDTTATIMLEQEKDSTDQNSTEPPAPTTLESVPEAQDKNQLSLFVTMLTMKVLCKCNILQNLSQDDWIPQLKRLVNQTMEQLDDYKDFCPDFKYNKKIRKAVLRHLKKKYKDKNYESLILQQDPTVEAAIVKAITAHIIDLSTKQKNTFFSRWDWIDVLHTVALGAAIVAAIVLMILLP